MVKFYKDDEDLKVKLNNYCSNIIKYVKNEITDIKNDGVSINPDQSYRIMLSEKKGYYTEIKFYPNELKLEFHNEKDKALFKIFKGAKYGKSIKNNIIELYNFGTCNDFSKYKSSIRKPRKIVYLNKEFNTFISILNKYIINDKIPYTLFEPYEKFLSYQYDEDDDEYDPVRANEIEEENNLNLYHGTRDIGFVDYDYYNIEVLFWCYVKTPFYPIYCFKKPKQIYYTEITETFECPISMSEYNEGYMTICGHKFGKDNLIEWLNYDSKKCCPLCRTKLKDD